MQPDTASILVCPVCKGKLAAGKNELLCPACALGFAVKESGIPDMIAHNARKLSGDELDALREHLRKLQPSES